MKSSKHNGYRSCSLRLSEAGESFALHLCWGLCLFNWNDSRCWSVWQLTNPKKWVFAPRITFGRVISKVTDGHTQTIVRSVQAEGYMHARPYSKSEASSGKVAVSKNLMAVVDEIHMNDIEIKQISELMRKCESRKHVDCVW